MTHWSPLPALPGQMQGSRPNNNIKRCQRTVFASSNLHGIRYSSGHGLMFTNAIPWMGTHHAPGAGPAHKTNAVKNVTALGLQKKRQQSSAGSITRCPNHAVTVITARAPGASLCAPNEDEQLHTTVGGKNILANKRMPAHHADQPPTHHHEIRGLMNKPMTQGSRLCAKGGR